MTDCYIEKFVLIAMLLIFFIGCGEKPYTVPYETGAADKNEITVMLEVLSQSIESDEPISIYRIEGGISPYYQVSDDSLTKELVDLELIPEDYLDILPTYTRFFQRYKNIKITELTEPKIIVDNDTAVVEVSYSLNAVSEVDGLSDIGISHTDTIIFAKTPYWKIIQWKAVIQH